MIPKSKEEQFQRGAYVAPTLKVFTITVESIVCQSLYNNQTEDFYIDDFEM